MGLKTIAEPVEALWIYRVGDNGIGRYKTRHAGQEKSCIHIDQPQIVGTIVVAHVAGEAAVSQVSAWLRAPVAEGGVAGHAAHNVAVAVLRHDAGAAEVVRVKVEDAVVRRHRVPVDAHRNRLPAQAVGAALNHHRVRRRGGGQRGGGRRWC